MVENREILLSDMTTFSVKQQERRLKKALEVKQESSRIDSSTIKSILSCNKEKELRVN
jgi:hypothetical protein